MAIKNLINAIFLILLIGSIPLGSLGFSESFNSSQILDKYKRIPSKLDKKIIQESGISNKTDNSHRLNTIGKSSDQKNLPKMIIDSINLPEGINLKSENQKTSLNLLESQNSIELSNFWNGIKFCKSKVKATPVGDKLIISGKVPSKTPDASISEDSFSTIEATVDQIISLLESPDLKVSSSEKCLFPDKDEYIPVWEVVFQIEGKTYQAVADDSNLYELHSWSFSAVNGLATIYEKNPDFGVIKSYSLNQLSETGYLENLYFKTRIDSTSSEQRANKTDYIFSFDPISESSEFIETSLFTNANRILGFFASIGYSSFGSYPIIINVHDETKANAQYSPVVLGSPVISVGDGDGRALKNLSLDSDVVNHEFAHHVIFGSLRDTNTVIDGLHQVAIMHEGLADYFSHAFSNDDCLGESICVKNSLACYQINQCLRTANNEMTMTNYPQITEIHLRSQFISGFLWSIRTNSAVEKNRFDKTALTAVSLLNTDSGFQDLLLNLLIADKNLSSSSEDDYCELIVSEAEKRGLSVYLDYNCVDHTYTELNSAKSDPPVTGGGSGDSGKKSSSFLPFCGTIQGIENYSNISFLVWLLIPLFLGLIKLEDRSS